MTAATTGVWLTNQLVILEFSMALLKQQASVWQTVIARIDASRLKAKRVSPRSFLREQVARELYENKNCREMQWNLHKYMPYFVYGTYRKRWFPDICRYWVGSIYLRWEGNWRKHNLLYQSQMFQARKWWVLQSSIICANHQSTGDGNVNSRSRRLGLRRIQGI